MLTQEQLLERLGYVTGSDAAVICGKSPYNTPLQLWMEKTGRMVPHDISDKNHIKFGNYMEDGVAKWFEAESGKRLMPPNIGGFIHSKENPWMAGNIDRLLADENAILECKTALLDDQWEEDTIPVHYLLQVAHYCAVGNYDRAYIAVVFSQKREMRWYTYERNLALEAKLIEKERHFWFENVQKDIAPEATNSDDILAFFKETTSTPVVAIDEIEESIARLVDANENIKVWEEIANALKENMKLFMRDADTLTDNSGKILATWKYTKPIKGFDKNALKKEMPDIYDKFVIEGDKQRRFNLKGKNNES